MMNQFPLLMTRLTTLPPLHLLPTLESDYSELDPPPCSGRSRTPTPARIGTVTLPVVLRRQASAWTRPGSNSRIPQNQDVPECGHDSARLLVVGDVVQDGSQDHRHRAGEVQPSAHVRVQQDRPRVTQIPGRHSRTVIVGQSCASVDQYDRVVVHIHRPDLGVDVSGDLVKIPSRRIPAAHIQKLGNPLSGKEFHRPAQERPM
jgi:hypothetical protein